MHVSPQGEDSVSTARKKPSGKKRKRAAAGGGGGGKPGQQGSRVVYVKRGAVWVVMCL